MPTPGVQSPGIFNAYWVLCCAAVILLQAAKAWQVRNEGKMPRTSQEKAAFKDLIKSWQRQIDGVPVQVCLSAFGLAGSWLSSRRFFPGLD